MQLGISLKWQNFTSSLAENDLSLHMELSKGRPYLIFWLGQVCFDAVKAKRNDWVCVGLVTAFMGYFLLRYRAASFGKGGSSRPLGSEMATRQAGREEQINSPGRKSGNYEGNRRFVCWGFVFSNCSRILPFRLWGSLRKGYGLCLSKPLLPLDR